jgi:hypothetical protein
MECVRRALCALLCAALVACASAPPDTADGVVHVLKPGENLYRLSLYYEVPVESIVRANHIGDVSDLPIGSRLRIPGARREAAPDSLASLVPPVTARGGSARDSGLDFAWPVMGKLSSHYGWRSGRHHEGVDISARPGTPVRASEAGRVIFSGRMGSYGQMIIVKHAGRYSTVYAHNRKNLVSKGAFVERGQVIAEVGTTGNASGPHVHFEVRRDRGTEDPLRYLP